MLGKDTKCWICGRTEKEIITEIRKKTFIEEFFYDGLPKREQVGAYATKEGLIELKRVSDKLGYNYPVCKICQKLVLNLTNDNTMSDRTIIGGT